MGKITIDTYNLFCEHGGEMLWASDPIRYPRPNATTKQTDEMFVVLERVDHLLEMIGTGFYSDKLLQQYRIELKKYKSRIDDKVYELLEKKYE